MIEKSYKLSSEIFEIDKSFSNCSILKDVDNIQQLAENEAWILLLFCSWYNDDVMMLNIILKLSHENQDVKFGFKCYDKDEDMGFFYKEEKQKIGTTPVLLSIKNRDIKFIKQGPFSINRLTQKDKVDLVQSIK
jgi:hypothetical protein